MYKLEVKKSINKDGIVTYKSHAFVGNNDEEKKKIYFNELKRIVDLEYSIDTDEEYKEADIVICILRMIDDLGYAVSGIGVDMWNGIYFKYAYKLKEGELPKPLIVVEFYGILDALVDAYNILVAINNGTIEDYINANGT